MKKNLLLGVAAWALLAACTGQNAQSDEPVHSVMVVQPTGSVAEMQKTFSGIVEEGREIGVAFKTGGQIARIMVKEGDLVREGQLIAVLDDKDYRLGADAARIQYEQMQRELARMKKLYDAKSLSGNDYDKAVSGLEQLKIQLQNHENQLSYTKLYAPTSGYVQKVNFEASEMVGAGSPVVNLLDVKQMEITFNIPTSLYLLKDQFKAFTCCGSFSNGQPVAVKLLSITPKADNNQLYKVRLGLNPADAKTITSGMNVEVKVEMEASGETQGLSVPVSAVFNQDGKAYVWVLDGKNNMVNRKAVKTGVLKDEAMITITEGLTGNEQVVRAGVNVLQDNEKVKVIAKPSETNVGGLI
ncbi:MAG: efflux RND transporter periplasmic adaptor subunit [Bacteroidales bacterium]|nr:efflux RND transporter periplasmic adaptor subunit [Bacteroidales bacterium]